MKSRILSIIVKGIYCVMFLSFLVSCSSITKTTPENRENTGEIEESRETNHDVLTPEQKATLAKNRRKEINLIRSGDYFLSKNNLDEALVRYSEALEKLPDDIVLEKKIAHTYFLKKDWENALLYFQRVPFGELSREEQKQYIAAWFSRDVRGDFSLEILSLPLKDDEKIYYQISEECLSGVESCIQAVSAYTGTSLDIQTLQDAILKAPKISPDLAYRNFSLAMTFYLQSQYRVSLILAKEILKDRGDYFDVQKLLGFSYFALGEYHESKKALIAHLENVPNDLETIVRLAELAVIEKDFIQSNLYLNNALNSGYPKKTSLERQLAYNYSELGDTAGMMKVLSYLVNESDALEEDFAVAISLAFSRGENARAYVWSIEGLKKFPESEILTPLYMTALRIIGRGDEVESYVATLSGHILELPLVILERGINHFDSGSYETAKEYFDEVIEKAPDTEFGQEATNYLNEIGIKLNQPSSSQDDSNGWW